MAETEDQEQPAVPPGVEEVPVATAATALQETQHEEGGQVQEETAAPQAKEEAEAEAAEAHTTSVHQEDGQGAPEAQEEGTWLQVRQSEKRLG